MARKKKSDLINFFREKIAAEEPTKVVKTRKRMTEEQRLAAAERVKKVREKRAIENPPQYKNVHPSVLERGEKDPLNFLSVKGWISSNRIRLKEARSMRRRGEKTADNLVSSITSYISIMESYLRTGDWCGMFCGENEDQFVKTHCVALAYHSNGYPKRTVGVYYPDLGETWTQEMDVDYRENVLKM